MNEIEPEIEEDAEKKPIVIRNSTDLQRLKLERLMKNPDKLVVIPERQKEKDVPIVPDFVRNVMGSSAGAGSGEFHVYRHLRRKEYARQKFMKEKAEREKLDDDYHNKLSDYKKNAEEKTAKKRLKRLKKKQKQKKRFKKQKSEESDNEQSESSDNSEESETTKSVDSQETKLDLSDNVDDKPVQLEDSCENEVIKITDSTQNLNESSPENISKDFPVAAETKSSSGTDKENV